MAMPCDCILLSGSVIINEAMLTGESTPIIKSHLPNIKQNFDEEIDSKYFLYAGTKIVQKRSENKKPIIALVYATGFNSVKGNLIRSILYPLQGDSKFERESSRFMIIMAILCIIGYIAVLPTRIIYAMNLKDDDDRKDEYIEIVNKGLDLITTAVPPSLPCCLGIGIGTAQRTIKKKGIMCINRNKITSAGKINICVFDKTGTLTEDHLNIAGFLPVEAHGSENKYEPQSIFTFDRYSKLCREYFSSCTNNIIPCIMPNWDHSPRSLNRGEVMIDCSPDKFCKLLVDISKIQKNKDHNKEVLIFIKSWNEWGEGNYLEPDQKWGHAYLEATFRALTF
jgi:magnesium-transporting ATPase (P-type)